MMSGKTKTIGILAHVDAGKTTLIEQLLVASGKRKEAGRVDHGTAFLDTDAQEKARGITISSKMCRIETGDRTLIFMDTPGHVDFTAESERVLPILDAAVLLVGAGERIPAHAQYLFRLLQEYAIPTVVFFNKTDLPGSGEDALLEQLKEALGEGFLKWEQLVPEEIRSNLNHLEKTNNDNSPDSKMNKAECILDSLIGEEVAVLDDGLMEHYLMSGVVSFSDAMKLFHQSRLFPVCFGSALQGKGVSELLRMLTLMTEDGAERSFQPDQEEVVEQSEAEPFGAYCYKIIYDESGQRVSFLKILSGHLEVRDMITYFGKDDTERNEKVTQLRLYDGASFKAVQGAYFGDIVAVTGLASTFAGGGLGIAPSRKPENSKPMLRYRLLLPDSVEARAFLPKLRQLEEEEDTLSVDWLEDKEEIEVELYGEVQLEVLTEKIRERFGIEVSFDEGNVVYRETLASPSYGMGHFEPLRHYAEVHFLMEPLPRGTGILLESQLSTDELDRNWQQTILNAVSQEQLTGVLTNSLLTDVKITLVAGRSHKKHTEGGDFREASLRAIRQGLMCGESILLEPYVHFTLTVPQEAAGRALYDMTQLAAESRITEQTEQRTTIEGRGAVSKLRNYIADVRAYTHGEGLFRMIYDGYDVATDQDAVVEQIGYQPESDLSRPSGSVFVDHGAATYVPWDQVPDWMHLEQRFGAFYPDTEEEEESGGGIPSRKEGSLTERLDAIGTDEIDRILQQASHANQSGEHAKERRKRWARANGRKNSVSAGGSGCFAEKQPGRIEFGESSEIESGKSESVDSSEEKSGKKESGERGSEDRNNSKNRDKRSRKPEKRNAYLLVDGYNILHAWEETKDLLKQDIHAARGVLLDILVDYKAMIDAEMIVVFDAYRVEGHRTETMEYHNLHVVFTKAAETADHYIARFTTEHEKKDDITVATSDGLVQLIIRGAGARLFSARDLHDEVMAKRQMLKEMYLKKD